MLTWRVPGHRETLSQKLKQVDGSRVTAPQRVFYTHIYMRRYRLIRVCACTEGWGSFLLILWRRTQAQKGKFPTMRSLWKYYIIRADSVVRLQRSSVLLAGDF